MVAVSAMPTEVAPPPVIPSYAGLLPTLRAAGLVAETWQQAVSLAVASGMFVAEIGGNLLTAETALELDGTVDQFIDRVTVIYGKRFLDSFTFRGESIQEHRPVGCGDADIWIPQCVAATDVAADQIPKSISNQAEIVTQYPIQIQANDQCSTWAPDLEERQFRALANLSRHESNILARELWTGAAAAANGWPNLSLAGSANPVGGGTQSAVSGLGALQHALADQLGDGQAGIIYARRDLVEKWWADGGLYWLQQENAGLPYWNANGYMVDIYQNIIVSSGGFTTNDIAYASGPIVVRMGEVQIIPPGWNGGAPELTRNNDFTVYAERYAGYELDDCAIFSVDINLCGACTQPAS